ncbi:MAG: uroporphyrinogen decarboxylase [Pseudomonadota bacterium]
MDGKPLVDVAKGELRPGRTPIWMMRQAGRHLPEFLALKAERNGFLDLCYTPTAAVEATMQPVRRYDIDAAIIFSDILVVPHGLGQKVEFNPGPMLEPLPNAAAIDALSIDRMSTFLTPMYDAISGVAAALQTERPQCALFGFCGAPFTVASYMIEGRSSKDHDSVRRWAAQDPTGFSALLDLLIESNSAHLINQIRAGADIVQIFDSWAGDLTDDEVRRWSLEPTIAIARKVRAAAPDTPISVFPRGVGALTSAFEASGAFDVIGLSPEADLKSAASWPNARPQGNLDPQILISGGDFLTAATAAILDALDGRPFIFNLGHGVDPTTPIPHVHAMIKQIRDRDANV